MTTFTRNIDSSDSTSTVVNSDGVNPSTWQVNGDTVLPQQPPRRRAWWRFFTIEPLTFLYGISSVIGVVYLNEQIKLRVCEQELGYNTTVCSMLGKKSSNATGHLYMDEINAQVQKRWAMWVLYQHLVSCIVGAIITAFAGAWSDSFGRKPPMIMVLIGLSISSIICLIFVSVATAPLYILLIHALFSSLFGNWSIMFMCIVSYIADVSNDATRTVRIAVAESGIGIGAAFGGILASVLIQTRVPQVTVLVALALYLLSLVFVLFAVRETRERSLAVRERMAARYPGANPSAAKKFLQALSQVFTLDNLRDAYAAVTRRRPHHIRLYILLCAVAMFLFIVQITGEQGVIQQYFEFPPLSWTYVQYQHYASVFGVIEIIAVFAVYFVVFWYFKVRDTIVMVMGASSCFVRALIMLGARTTVMVVIASCVGLLKYIGSISFRVCVSKLVERDEQARGFALIAVAETLAPIAGSAAYATMLTAGVDWKWTNAVFLVSAVDTGLRLLVAVIVCVGTWRFYKTYSAGSGERPAPAVQNGHASTFSEPRIEFAAKTGNSLSNNEQQRVITNKAFSIGANKYGSMDDFAKAGELESRLGATPAAASGGVTLDAVDTAELSWSKKIIDS